MQFKIEQIAIRPENRERARALLEKIGLAAWIDDKAAAAGSVRGDLARNVADLSFCYDGEPAKPLELELINYEYGRNWLPLGASIVSHVGMHCTLAELAEWRALFASEGIEPVQEVTTTSHSNPAIAQSRRYHYCIFGTREILGLDLKFIVRLDSGAAA